MILSKQYIRIFFTVLMVAFATLQAQTPHLFVVKSKIGNQESRSLYDSSGNPLLCGNADYFFRCGSLIFSSINNYYALWSSDGNTKLADSLEDVRCAWYNEISYMASKNGLWSYYLADGSLALQGAWQKITDFYEGVAMVYDGSEDIFINVKGEKLDTVSAIVSEHFNWKGMYEGTVSVAEIPTFNHPDYSVITGTSGVGIKRKSDKKIILESEFDRIVSNKGEYVIIVKHNQYGVFHLSKEIMIIPCQFLQIHDEI